MQKRNASSVEPLDTSVNANINKNADAEKEESPTSCAQVPTSSDFKTVVATTTTAAAAARSASRSSSPSSSSSSSSSSSIPDESKSTSGITVSCNDVLLGRGGGTNRHPGNVYYRKLVSSKQPEYVRARKLDKSKIAKSIVSTIRQNNGRFLRNEAGTWVDVGDRRATEKTSQALREGLTGRMRVVVREGGVGLSRLKEIGFSVYEDDMTRNDVQSRAWSYERELRKREREQRDHRRRGYDSNSNSNSNGNSNSYSGNVNVGVGASNEGNYYRRTNYNESGFEDERKPAAPR